MEMGMVSIAFLREIIGSEVEAGRNKLGPHIISDPRGLGPMSASRLLGGTMLRIGSVAAGPAPILEVAKEYMKNRNVSSARVGREDLLLPSTWLGRRRTNRLHATGRRWAPACASRALVEASG